MDHHEARIFDVSLGVETAMKVSAPRHHVHRHPKGSAAEHNHPDDATRFFADVAGELRTASQILLVGPSIAKLQFLHHLRERHREIHAKVVGVESVDHPSDLQLLAHARRFFSVPSPRMSDAP